jgi:hypothetical protein
MNDSDGLMLRSARHGRLEAWAALMVRDTSLLTVRAGF